MIFAKTSAMTVKIGWN